MSRRIKIGKEAAMQMKLFGRRIPPEPEKSGEQENTAEPSGTAESFVTASRTDVGKVRQSNQDAVIVSGRLLGVADGMGGHKGGEVASAMLRDMLIEQLRDKEPDPTALARAVRAANRRIFIRSQENEELRGMGTTLDVLWFGPESVYIAHVGDSRVYCVRGGRMKQITEDHSMVMEMVRAGFLTMEQAEKHPMRNVITRAVGTENSVELDLLSVARQKDDIWLVCSDGLHGMISEERICAALRENEPEKAADLLLQAALEAGGRDNVSLVIAKDGEGVL